VVVLDLDGDGKPDIYVANDGVGNFLYRNRSTPGRLRFDEIGVSSGVAFNDRGTPDGSMGTDAGDYEGSGRPSLWVANYEDQLHALYRNIGRGLFVFNTTQAGIAAIGQSYVGFGTGFLDLDHHGWEDLVVVNGHVLRHPHRAQLRQRPVLLRNQGNGRFRDITSQGGSYFRDGHIARGLAIGDLDKSEPCRQVLRLIFDHRAPLRFRLGVHPLAVVEKRQLMTSKIAGVTDLHAAKLI
jgi:hypothetical protein